MSEEQYRWIGPKTLEVREEEWDFAADKTTCVLMLVGPMAECRARKPAVGSTYEGFSDYGVKVAGSKAKRRDGDSGELTITLEATVAPAAGSGATDPSTGAPTGTPVGDPIYELDWTELTKALETHPDCGTLKPGRPRYQDGVKVTDSSKPGKRRTWEDWADLDDDDYDGSGGKWSLATYQAKRERGEESYVIGAPVARRTTYYNFSPSSGGAFYREFPPVACGAPLSNGHDGSYEYLKTADKLTKEGRKRTRIEEWTGAEEIDPDVY